MSKIQIGPNDMHPIKCAECDCQYFRQVVAINKVSKFLTGSDKDTMIPAPTFRCDDCGAVPDDFKPVKVGE